MSLDHIKAMRPDHRDDLTLHARMEVFKQVECIHHEMKDSDEGIAKRRELINLVSGPRGGGKTLGSWTEILIDCYLWGAEVYSVASLLIGKRMTAAEAYLFPDFVDPGSATLLDEAASYMERYAEHSNRQRGLSQSMAAMRKIQAELWAVSANESRIAGSLKEQVTWLLYPYKRKYRPKRSKGIGTGRWPSWAMMGWKAIGPHPFESPYMGQGAPYFALPERKTHNGPARTRMLNPQHVYLAAHLYDSWERVPILAGIRTTGRDITSAQDAAWEAAGADIDAGFSARHIDDQVADFCNSFAKAQRAGEFKDILRTDIAPQRRTMQIDGLFRLMQRNEGASPTCRPSTRSWTN